MKKLFNLSLVAAAVMTIFSCSKEIDQPITEASSAKSFTFNVVNNGVDTKASLNASASAFQWEEGDKVGVFFENNLTDKNLSCSVNTFVSPAQITIAPTVAINKDNIYAYYPYNSYEHGIKLEIPAEQNGNNIQDAMPMRANTLGIENWEAGEKTPTLQFNNLAGVLEFNVYSENADFRTEKVVSITFASTSTVGGVYYPNYTTESGLGTINEPYNSITASIPAANQKVVGESKDLASNLVYMVVAEDAYTDATITVVTDKAIYTTTTPLEFAGDGLEVSANSIVPFNINLANAKFTRKERTINKTIVFQSYDNKVVTDDGGNKWDGSIACSTANQLPANFSTTNANDRGACFGATATLTSQQEFVGISEIVVECSSNGTGNKISVSVGGTEFTSESETISKSNHQQVTFTSATPASGAIEISINRSASSIWIGGVIINPRDISVEGISLDKTTADLIVGQNLTLTATISPNGATNKSVTWTSSDATVATVDEGVVTAVAVGNATITATTVDGEFTAQCVVTVAEAGAGGGTTPKEVTFDFTKIDGFSEWGTGYSEHVVEYSEATVTFASANKQTSTITDQPVTKGKDVIVVMKDGQTINSLTFECSKWGSKAQTITLNTSTDGGANYTATATTSSNFTLTASDLSGVNAVKFTFSSTSNQVGIKSLTINYNANN